MPRLANPKLAPYGFGQCAAQEPRRNVRVCIQRSPMAKRQVASHTDVCEVMRGIAESDRESIYTLHLDQKNRVVNIEEVAKGALNISVTTGREIFKSAILSNAAAIILVHNHPSGDATPSAEDRELTNQVVAAGRLLGIAVRDHVIIGTEGCTSLREQMTGFQGVQRRRKRR